jgi:AcrR family transcriptional regulator
MPKRSLSLRAITDTAIGIVDRDGFNALTLSAVAQQLGVGPSALYTHVDGLDGLRYLVATTATSNLTSQVRDAAIGTSGDSALTAVGTAYRAFASNNPGQFAATLLPPRGDHDDLRSANDALLHVFILVYVAMGLSATDAQLAARSTRSAIHGFLALEHCTGTSPHHQAEYSHLLTTLHRGLGLSDLPE